MGAHKWKRIAERVPGRDHIQCIQRWKKVRPDVDLLPGVFCSENAAVQALDPTLRKGQWTKEEDDILQRVKMGDPGLSW